jgi:hypothetical protein
LTFSNFPGHPEDVTYQVRGEGSRDGWFFPGRENAPTIVLCPGYQRNRGELLTLASSLQYHEYNVFLFDFSGQGTSPGRFASGLPGSHGVARRDRRAGAAQRCGSHAFRSYGAPTSALMLRWLKPNPIRASQPFAVESAFMTGPEQELDLLVSRSGLGTMPLLPRAARWGFDWLARDYRGTPPLSAGLQRLERRAQTFYRSRRRAGTCREHA